MRIIIDADAIKVNIIEEIAYQNNIECFIFCDNTHNIESDISTVYIFDKHYQNVDMKIIAFVKENDLIITNDYGLASILLTKNCLVIDSKGKEYNSNNIDILLQNRYLNLKSKHKKGPKKRTIEDDKNLIITLERIIGEL